MKTIKEYLNSQGKTIEVPDNILDQTKFTIPKNPEKNLIPGWDTPKERREKSDAMFAPKSKNKELPYVATEIKVKEDQPLGELNTPGNIYPTEIELDNTLNTVKEIENVIGQNESVKQSAPKVLSESGKLFHPDPIQAIKYVVHLTNKSDDLLKAFITEAKNTGCISKYAELISQLPKFI